VIQLVPKTEKEFQTYLKEETARYAEANVKAGYWKKTEALKNPSKRTINSYLRD